MKILYIVPYTPTPIRTRPYNIIRTLARLGHQVTLATIWENPAEKQTLEQIQASGVEVIAEPLSRIQIAKNLASALLKHTPLQSRYSYQPKLAKQIDNILAKYHQDCDIIHVEHLRGAIYGLKILKTMANGAPRRPIVWDSVDNITALFHQAASQSGQGFGRWVTRIELPLTRRYEALLTGKFDRILVTSPVDQAAFTDLSHQPDRQTGIEVLSNGVDLEVFTPTTSPRRANSIVFSGKLSYHANISSAKFLVEQVMPIVWARRPLVQVSLVGKDPHPSLQKLAEREPRVIVTGTVPDIRPFLQTASLAAVTLTYGAGVQNKVLESMACAVPVVSTSAAVSALQAVSGQDVLVSDEPAGLADHILRLLENPELNQQIGTNGYRYVQQHHNWNDIAKNLITIYENLVQSN